VACPCCYQRCCRNGYPTITFTISGGTTGVPWCGNVQSDCSSLNGSYVFSGEAIALGTVGSMSREFTIMPGCEADPQGRWTYYPRIGATIAFNVGCNGLVASVVGLIDTRAVWNIVWQDLEVDPDDGCAISGSYGPAPPNTYVQGPGTGAAPGFWGSNCGGPPGVHGGTYGPTLIRLAATITR